MPDGFYAKLCALDSNPILPNGAPCTIAADEDLWAVCGGMLDTNGIGGGIIEWHLSEETAKRQADLMRHQYCYFDIRAEKYLPITSGHKTKQDRQQEAAKRRQREANRELKSKLYYFLKMLCATDRPLLTASVPEIIRHLSGDKSFDSQWLARLQDTLIAAGQLGPKPKNPFSVDQYNFDALWRAHLGSWIEVAKLNPRFVEERSQRYADETLRIFVQSLSDGFVKKEEERFMNSVCALKCNPMPPTLSLLRPEPSA